MILSDCFPDTYVVADIETSGLSPRSDRVLEIAVICVLERRVVWTEQWVLNPSYPYTNFVVPSVISEITGITSEVVGGGMNPVDALNEYALRASNVVVYFHNGYRFDIPFLSAEAVRCGVSVPHSPTYLDTAVLYKAHVLGRIDEIGLCINFEVFADSILSTHAYGLKYNLRHCCEDLGVDIASIGGLHRAVPDAMATYRLVEALRETLAP